jgi:hypothetical protein
MHYVTSRNVAGLILDAIGFVSSSRNPYTRTMALALTQPKLVRGIFLGGKGEAKRGRRVGKADNLTTICEPIFRLTLWRQSVLPVRYELDCKYCYK